MKIDRLATSILCKVLILRCFEKLLVTELSLKQQVGHNMEAVISLLHDYRSVEDKVF